MPSEYDDDIPPELLLEYLTDLQNDLHSVRRLVEERDFNEIAMFRHKLKGF
jgi:hypothetical protein